MTERDDELARALGDLPVPDHAPDFWGRLERRLDDPTAVPPGGIRLVDAPGERAAGDPVIVHGIDGGDPEPAVVPLRPPRGEGAPGRGASRGRGPAGRRGRVLLAAAAIVALAGGATVASQLDEGDGDVMTVAGDPASTSSPSAGTLEAPGERTQAGPSTGDPATSRPGPAVAGDPTRLGPIEAVSPGLVVGVLPASDGTARILVRDVLPGDEVGCEGAPLEGLLALAGDGRARPVLSAEGTAIVNGADVHPSPDGDRVAVVSQCEGYLGQLLVGHVGPDGLPTDLHVVAGDLADGTRVPGGPEADGVSAVAWTPDSGRLLVTTARSSGATTERQLWSYEPSTGTWSRRADAPAGVVAAVERRDGTLVAVTEDGLVVGDEAGPRNGVNALTLGPDGETVAAYGADGLVVVDGAGESELVAPGQVGRAEFLPDGSHLVLSRFSEAEGRNEIATVPLDVDRGERPASGSGPDGVAVLGATVWGWFEVLPDASGLVVTVEGEVGTDGYGRPFVERWPFAAS